MSESQVRRGMIPKARQTGTKMILPRKKDDQSQANIGQVAAYSAGVTSGALGP